MYFKILKPFFDFFLAFTLLLLTSPLILILWIVLRMQLSANPIFKQSRPGYNGIVFTINKFKSMTDERDSDGCLLPDTDRLTKIGSIIRKLSLDELPQLFNILKGEMSFIGPRPLLIEYLELYDEEQKKRHLVKPGISGWAQVNGRNAITWEQKFKLDVWYVKNQSFSLDMKIIFMTLKKVILAEDISSNTSVTMEKFRGSL